MIKEANCWNERKAGTQAKGGGDLIGHMDNVILTDGIDSKFNYQNSPI